MKCSSLLSHLTSPPFLWEQWRKGRWHVAFVKCLLCKESRIGHWVSNITRMPLRPAKESLCEERLFCLRKNEFRIHTDSMWFYTQFVTELRYHSASLDLLCHVCAATLSPGRRPGSTGVWRDREVDGRSVGDPAGCVQSKQEEEQHQTNLRSPCLPYGLLSWLVSALNLSCHPKEAADRSLPCLK